jgi:mitochondrial fission protein ELM1
MENAFGDNAENIAPKPAPQPAVERSLAGLPAWIIADGRAGHLAITLGIAEALGLEAMVKSVEPRRPFRLLAPWGPADPRVVNTLLKEPWPEIALGAGRQSVPTIRALKRKTGGLIFTVLCQDPKTSLDSADVIWAPEHDRVAGANVISTLTPPHRFGPERLAALRLNVRPQIARLPPPRFALFLGGPGGGYHWTPAQIERLAKCLHGLARQGASFLITPSRRTPPDLLRAVDAPTANSPRLLWTRGGENPYPDFLAHADAFIVTADSVNMVSEASASGRPIYVFHPQGGRAKFRRYHAALEALGATRPLTEKTSILDNWHYEPLDAARVVAAEIERRWRQFRIGSCAQPA